MKKTKGGKKPPPKKAKAPVKKLVPKVKPKKSNPQSNILTRQTDYNLMQLVRNELKKMNASKQKALLALAAAATAVAAAAAALAEPDEGTPAAAETKPPTAAKPKAAAKVEPCKAAVTGPNTTTPRVCIKPMPHGANEHEFPPEAAVVKAAVAAVKQAAAPAAAATGEVPIFDQVVAAFKEYCAVYTRPEGIKVIAPFIPEGKKTLADIPEESLPALLAKLLPEAQDDLIGK